MIKIFPALFHQKNDNGFSEKLRNEREKNELIKELAKTKKALEHAYSNFEYVIDPDLIDSSIYELNAINKQYKFLLEKVKSF